MSLGIPIRHLLVVARLSSICLLGATLQAADEPLSVALALDTSGSIRPNDMREIRKLADAVIAALPAGTEFSVFSFDDQARLLLPRATDPDTARQVLQLIAPHGRYTTLHDALYETARYLRNAPGSRKAILLFTDGKDENSDLVLEDGLNAAQSARIPVVTVGIGKAQEKTLRRISRLSGGIYFSAQGTNAAALAQALQEAAPRVPVAQPALTPTPAAPVGSPPATAPLSAAPRAAYGIWLLGICAAMLISAAIFWMLVRLRRQRGARCHTCGTKWEKSHGPCPHCSLRIEPDVPETVRIQAPVTLSAPPPIEAVASVLSETVLNRLNETQEFLDKTITLRERPVLLLMNGRGEGQTFILSEATLTSIGRARANDIVLDDVAVSSQHCRIQPIGDSFVVFDLKSTNGTFVNEQRIAQHTLSEGDVLRVGETRLKYFHSQQRADA
ncbi:MAG: FHA domain-containing protein [Vicinamibacteria bacterium]|jgi:hypothetical protein|nr:FHA domain-containing protein [Vicinamibacteria bacterium]